MNPRRWWIMMLGLIGAAALLTWGFMITAPTRMYVSTRLQMGTLVSISTWGVEENKADRAMDLAFEEIGRIEAMMSRFMPESAVAHLNQAPRGEPHAVPEELIGVIERGVEMGRLTRGAFDIGIAPLSDVWGFSREPPPEAPPPTAAIHNWLDARNGLPDQGITITPEQQILLANTAVALDLGGIAKGYAVERALEVLQRAGVANALINAGGDMRIAGAKGGQPWHIGLRDPRNPEGVVAVMDVAGSRAISTSGDYERYFMSDGVRYHHILDPKLGAPARSGLISVTVQAADSMTADALSTALFVLGGEEGLKLLRHFPGSEAFLIRADGTFIKTPGFIGTKAAPR
ncbi:MAG: FAD:protein FMN transferase [Magnetococcales bacterium]|nr:FAD:protein FMN transferase [Magnetococcales bacterium]